MQILLWKKLHWSVFNTPLSHPSVKRKNSFFPIFVFRKVLDCKHLKEMKGGWPVHPKFFPDFHSFYQQPSVLGGEGGTAEERERCLCFLLKFKVQSRGCILLIFNLLIGKGVRRWGAMGTREVRWDNARPVTRPQRGRQAPGTAPASLPERDWTHCTL